MRSRYNGSAVLLLHQHGIVDRNCGGNFRNPSGKLFENRKTIPIAGARSYYHLQFDRSSMRTRFSVIIAHELLPPYLSLRSKRKRYSASRGASTSSPSNCERLASVEVYQSVSEGVALIFHRFQFAVAGISQQPRCCRARANSLDQLDSYKALLHRAVR